MACSLTYDDTLARVRVDADSLCVTGIVDTFSRSVTGSWGTADSGQSWVVVGTASDYGVTGGQGEQTNTTTGVTHGSIIDLGSTDCDFTVTFSSDKAAVGNSQVIEVVGRYTDTGNYYAARALLATTGVITLDLRKRVATVETALLTAVTVPGTHGANTMFRVRLSIQGTALQAKLWPLANDEPDWQVTATDSSLVTGTNIGLRSVLTGGTSNLPVKFRWDNLATDVPTYATVDRTTDQVTYTVVRGASEVGVTTGCELEEVVDDYEFPVGQLITYRVRSFTSEGVAAVTTTCQITVDLDDVWLKSIGRPFLNRAMRCVGNPSPITRRARNGIFPIVGRSYPVAVTDLRGSREVVMTVITKTTQEREDLDLLLASGDPVFVQTPLTHPLPTMYAVIGDTSEERPVLNRLCDNDWRRWELPLTEVAAPGPDVVGSTSTWQTVVSTYATWADVMAAHATWASVLELIGDGSEVLVP